MEKSHNRKNEAEPWKYFRECYLLYMYIIATERLINRLKIALQFLDLGTA